jgi:hypothetical protein
MDYRKFLEGLEPAVLGLNSSTFSLNREAYWAQSQKARRVLSSRYKLGDVAEDYFDIEASFSVWLQSTEDDGPVVQSLRIECVFFGHFHTAKPIDREHAQKFTDSDCWLVFWPFFRQFVSDTTARMSIPPLVVPMALGPGEYSHRRRSSLPAENAREEPVKPAAKPVSSSKRLKPRKR